MLFSKMLAVAAVVTPITLTAATSRVGHRARALEFYGYESSSSTSSPPASSSSSSSSVASQDNKTTTIIVAFSSTEMNGYTSSVPIAYYASSGLQTSSTPANDLTSSSSSSSSALPTGFTSSVNSSNSVQSGGFILSSTLSSSAPGNEYTSSANSSSAIATTDVTSSSTSSSSVPVQTITTSILSSSSVPVEDYTTFTANISTNANATMGSAASSLSSNFTSENVPTYTTNPTSVTASVATGYPTSYPILVTVYTASGQSQISSLGPDGTSNATLGGYQTPTSGPLSNTPMSGQYPSSAWTASSGFPSQANATSAPGTLVYSLVLPPTSASGSALASQYLSSAGTAVSGFPSQANGTGVPGTLVYSLILSSTPASGFASASGAAGSSGTGVYGYGIGSASGSYNSSTIVGSAVSQASAGTISGYSAYSVSQSNAGSGSFAAGATYPSAQTTSSSPANGSGNSSISCYAGNATTAGQNVTVTCAAGTPNSLSSGGIFQQGSILPTTATYVLPGSYASSTPGNVPIFVPQSGGTPSSGSSGDTTIVVTLTMTRCGACANTATGTPNSLSSGATLPATGVDVPAGSFTSSAYGYVSSLVAQPQSTPVIDSSGPATVVVSLTMTQCGGCARPSVVPLYTPGMLGNAYGGGYISTPSVYAIVPSPSASGSAVGVPPGYGYSFQPGTPTAGSQSVYNSAVPTSPVSSVGSSVGAPQGYGSSLISGTPTTIVQPGSPTASGTPISMVQAGNATISGQSSYISAPRAYPATSSGLSVSSALGYEYSFVSGNPTPVLVPISGTALGTPTTIVETASPTLPGQSPYTSVVLTLPACPPGYGYSPQIESSAVSASGSSIQNGQSSYPSGIATPPASPETTGSAGSGSNAGSAGASNSESTSSVAPGGAANSGGVATPSASTPYSGSVNSGNLSVPVNPSALATYEGPAIRHGAMDMFKVLLVCLATLYVL